MIYRFDASTTVLEGVAVMVRTPNGAPAAFIAVAASGGVVILTPNDAGKRASIGVPRRCVFAHDDILFHELQASHDHGESARVRCLWARAAMAELSGLPPMPLAVVPTTYPS